MTWGPVQSTGNIIHGTAIVTSTTGLVHVPYNRDSNRNQLGYLRSRDNGMTWDTARDLIANMGTFGFNLNPRQHPIVGAAADPTGRTVAITGHLDADLGRVQWPGQRQFDHERHDRGGRQAERLACISVDLILVVGPPELERRPSSAQIRRGGRDLAVGARLRG